MSFCCLSCSISGLLISNRRTRCYTRQMAAPGWCLEDHNGTRCSVLQDGRNPRTSWRGLDSTGRKKWPERRRRLRETRSSRQAVAVVRGWAPIAARARYPSLFNPPAMALPETKPAFEVDDLSGYRAHGMPVACFLLQGYC